MANGSFLRVGVRLADGQKRYKIHIHAPLAAARHSPNKFGSTLALHKRSYSCTFGYGSA